MLKFKYKIKVFSNKSDISFCLKSVESLNCFLRCQSVLSRGCLLFYHGTKHLRGLYIILLLELLDLISFFWCSQGVQVPPSNTTPTPPPPPPGGALPLHANQIYSILPQSFDLRLCASQVHYISKPQYTFLYTRKSSVSVHRSRIFQTLLKNQLETYLHTKD